MPRFPARRFCWSSTRRAERPRLLLIAGSQDERISRLLQKFDIDVHVRFFIPMEMKPHSLLLSASEHKSTDLLFSEMNGQAFQFEFSGNSEFIRMNCMASIGARSRIPCFQQEIEGACGRLGKRTFGKRYSMELGVRYPHVVTEPHHGCAGSCTRDAH